jgi:hypothetical protein
MPSALIERDKLLPEFPVVVLVTWVMEQDPCPNAFCGQLPTSRRTRTTTLARAWQASG